MRHIIFTDNNRTGCVHINPMYNSRTHHTVDPRKMILAVEHHRIYHRMGVMTDTWMNDHSLWFVDDQYIFILIQNIQWNILRQNIRVLRFRKFQSYRIRKLDFIIGFHRFVIDRYISLF